MGNSHHRHGWHPSFFFFDMGKQKDIMSGQKNGLNLDFWYTKNQILSVWRCFAQELFFTSFKNPHVRHWINPKQQGNLPHEGVAVGSSIEVPLQDSVGRSEKNAPKCQNFGGNKNQELRKNRIRKSVSSREFSWSDLRTTNDKARAENPVHPNKQTYIHHVTVAANHLARR